jgi:hypothetical protein
LPTQCFKRNIAFDLKIICPLAPILGTEGTIGTNNSVIKNDSLEVSDFHSELATDRISRFISVTASLRPNMNAREIIL